MDIARTIRLARVRAGLSQLDLARRAGTSQPAVARYERSTVRPRSDTLDRLLTACGQNLDATTPPSTQRPFLGPLGYRLAAERERVVAALTRRGFSQARVTGLVALGTEALGDHVELLVDEPPHSVPAADLQHLHRELTELLGTTVLLLTTESMDPPTRLLALASARSL